jgi:hypothetical protein
MTKVSHDSAERILDVEQARTAALEEHAERWADNQLDHDVVPTTAGYERYAAERGLGQEPGPVLARFSADDGMVGPAYRVEHAPPVVDPELETRVRNTIYLVEQSTLGRKFAARQIIATVREHDAANRTSSAEGPTVSELTAERFGPTGAQA